MFSIEHAVPRRTNENAKLLKQARWKLVFEMIKKVNEIFTQSLYSVFPETIVSRSDSSFK